MNFEEFEINIDEIEELENVELPERGCGFGCNCGSTK